MKRSMIGSARLLAAALVVSFAGHVVLTTDAVADTLAKITESKYILMGTYNEPPHNWVELAGGGYKGIDYELASTILQALVSRPSTRFRSTGRA